jgi:hypothetical protein
MDVQPVIVKIPTHEKKSRTTNVAAREVLTKPHLKQSADQRSEGRWQRLARRCIAVLDGMALGDRRVCFRGV